MAIQWTQETFEQLAAGFTSWRSFLDKYPGAQSAQRSGKIDPWQVWAKGGGVKTPKSDNPYEDDPESIWEAPEADQLVEANWRPFAVKLSARTPNDYLTDEQIEECIVNNCRYWVDEAKKKFDEQRKRDADFAERIKTIDTITHIGRMNEYAKRKERDLQHSKTQAILAELKSRNLPPFVKELFNPIYHPYL